MHEGAGTTEPSNAGSSGAASASSESLGTVPLDGSHRVDAFKCSRSERVQGFIQGACKEFLKHNYCKVFVWPNPDDPTDVLGYYSLSSSLIFRAELSGSLQKKVPGGIPVPVVLY